MLSDSPFDESRTVPSSTWDARHPVSTPSPTIPGAWFDGIFPPDPLIGPICFSHFFDSWKQHRSGEGGLSRPHSLRRLAVGAKRRALICLPRSVHSPTKNG